MAEQGTTPPKQKEDYETWGCFALVLVLMIGLGTSYALGHFSGVETQRRRDLEQWIEKLEAKGK